MHFCCSPVTLFAIFYQNCAYYLPRWRLCGQEWVPHSVGRSAASTCRYFYHWRRRHDNSTSLYYNACQPRTSWTLKFTVTITWHKMNVKYCSIRVAFYGDLIRPLAHSRIWQWSEGAKLRGRCRENIMLRGWRSKNAKTTVSLFVFAPSTLQMHSRPYNCNLHLTIALSTLQLHSPSYNCTLHLTIALSTLQLHSPSYNCTLHLTIALSTLQLHSPPYNCTLHLISLLYRAIALVLLPLCLYFYAIGISQYACVKWEKKWSLMITITIHIQCIYTFVYGSANL